LRSIKGTERCERRRAAIRALQQAVERFADATAFIPSASAAQFSNPQQYEGQTVSVSGKITLYHGNPETSSRRLHTSAHSDSNQNDLHCR
jgi:hypothetical protein